MATRAIRIPEGVNTKQAKSLLDRAITLKLVPQAVLGATYSARIALNATEEARIAQVCVGTPAANDPVQSQAARLIAAAHQSEVEATRPPLYVPMLERLVSEGNFLARPEQQAAHDRIAKALALQGVTLLEAPTGSGKTLAQLCAAVDFLRHAERKQERVAIAVPTLNLIHQIEETYRKMATTGALPALGCLIGRMNFASEHRIQALLEDVLYQPAATDILAWLEGERAKLQRMRQRGLASLMDMPFLISNFRQAFPDEVIPEDAEITLHSSAKEGDAGLLAYRLHRQQADNTRILVVTQVMLALDARLDKIARWRDVSAQAKSQSDVDEPSKEAVEYVRGMWQKACVDEGETCSFGDYLSRYLASLPSSTVVIPAYDRLIVDEGDRLESSASSASTDELSLRALARYPRLAAARQSALLKQVNILTGIAKKSGDEELDELDLSARDSDDAAQALTALSEILTQLRGAKRKDDKIRHAIRVLSYVESSRHRATTDMVALIDFSQVHRYPRLRIGSKSVQHVLRHIWERTKSSIIVSATLSLPGEADVKQGYIARTLSVPGARRLSNTKPSYGHVIPPASWLHQPVTVYLPDGHAVAPEGARPWLSPPARPKGNVITGAMRQAYQSEYEAWLLEVADVLWDTAESAEGGTLVLLSSYDIAARLNLLLQAKGIPASRLVAADRRVKLNEQREKFVVLNHGGVRPIWLAVGGAWRGLDLTDDRLGHAESDQDTLLTDLVIPRLPMGVNRTLTYRHRKRLDRQFQDEISETLLHLKQGLGRLVRREGITPRRLFLLDTRIQHRATDKFYASLKAGVNALIAPYKKQSYVR